MCLVAKVSIYHLLIVCKTILSLSSKDVFAKYRILRWQFFFFHHFKDVTLLSSGLHDFKQVSCHSYVCSLVHTISFNLDALMIFFLSLLLGNLIMMDTDVIFFMSLQFVVPWASWICGFIAFNKFGNLSASISSNSYPSFWDSDYICVRLDHLITVA